MKIIFDIGANVGEITKKFLDNKENMVYSFEPLKEQYNDLKNLESVYPNLKVFNYAVSNEDGHKIFYSNEPHYTSSLKKFTSEKEDYGVELKEKNKLLVKVIKLSTFIKENNLQDSIIDYIKIDTQGSDYDVLCSIDEFLPNVRKIKLECFITPVSKSLYEDECKCHDIIEFMEKNNFKLDDRQNFMNKWSDLIFINKII